MSLVTPLSCLRETIVACPRLDFFALWYRRIPLVSVLLLAEIISLRVVVVVMMMVLVLVVVVIDDNYVHYMFPLS
jgi:hypothetical protein